MIVESAFALIFVARVENLTKKSLYKAATDITMLHIAVVSLLCGLVVAEPSGAATGRMSASFVTSKDGADDSKLLAELAERAKGELLDEVDYIPKDSVVPILLNPKRP